MTKIKDGNMIRRSIYISEDVAKHLQECADLNARSFNQMICWILQQWIDEDIKQGKEVE